jgi:hypothetical protein
MRRRTRSLAALAGLFGCLSFASSSPALTPPTPPLPVHVVFTGTGTFKLDNKPGDEVTAEDHLVWTTEYSSTIDGEGRLSPAEAVPSATVGDFLFADELFAVNCTGPLSTTPGPQTPGDPHPPPETTPSPKVEGFEVQSVAYLSTYDGDVAFSRCLGEKEFEGQGEAASNVGEVLDNYLPDAMTATLAPLPRQSLLTSGAAIHVENVNQQAAPTQVPESCSDLFGLPNPDDCTMSLSWSGTVLIDASAGCPVILAGPPPACVGSAGMTLAQLDAGFDADATGAGSASLSVTASSSPGSAARAHASRRVLVASAKTSANRAGRLRLRPHLTGAGRRLVARSRRLHVLVQIAFKPRSGGHAHTTRLSTVVRSR